MNRWLLSAPLAVFGIAGISLWFYFIDPDASGPFHDNLVPELIGFCLEGFVLIGLLSLLQQVREHDRRKQLWLSLRGSLRDFLSHLDVAMLRPDSEPASSHALENDPRVPSRLAADLKELELNLDDMVALKRVGINDLGLARDLIPVAAQLSPAHMRWWIAIVAQMRALSEADERSEIDKAVYNLLLNLKEFDALKY